MSTYTAQSREPGRAPVPISDRRDAWWVHPLLIAITLLVFSVYALWRAFEGNFFLGTQALKYGAAIGPHYLSPFYSPPVYEWFPQAPGKYALSPAFLVLIFPLSYRATCYYCRRAYYRAFFWDPPACAVGEMRAKHHLGYTGETRFPFLLQNLHRFTLYCILVVVAFHYAHLYQSLFYTDATGAVHAGLGLGTLVLALDAALLSLYVFSCHSWRHLVGGGINRFSSAKTRWRLWKLVSALNVRHGLYFWLSLITVGVADLYVRLVATGAIADVRFF
ncbi:MAG: succinate dehydrogenase [Chthonomonadales bacterium]|nr:succinate dehydrogenase [Chthonomonadales bacterium]